MAVMRERKGAGITFRLTSGEAQALNREAGALGLTTSAYLRFLTARGRERLLLEHALSLANPPESREAHFLELSALAETRALVRALAVRTLGMENVRKEQDAIAPGIQSWRTKLKVPEPSGP